MHKLSKASKEHLSISVNINGNLLSCTPKVCLELPSIRHTTLQLVTSWTWIDPHSIMSKIGWSKALKARPARFIARLIIITYNTSYLRPCVTKEPAVRHGIRSVEIYGVQVSCIVFKSFCAFNQFSVFLFLFVCIWFWPNVKQWLLVHLISLKYILSTVPFIVHEN